MALVFITFDVAHEAGLYAPYMVEQDFCVDPEHLIELSFIIDGSGGDIAERKQ